VTGAVASGSAALLCYSAKSAILYPDTEPTPGQTVDQIQTIKLESKQLSLSLTVGRGLQCSLEHVASGTLLADGAYFYSFGAPHFTHIRRNGHSVLLSGQTPTGIYVSHRLALNPENNYIEEEIEVRNLGTTPLDLPDVRCGFVLPMLLLTGHLEGAQAESKFVAVPFRREPRGGRMQYSDYSMEQILTGEFRSDLWSPDWARSTHPTVSSSFAAEGWIWSHGGTGFVISKYSQAGLEFAILDRVPLSEGSVGLRWGGIGLWLGSPEQGTRILPGEGHHFGITRLTHFDGEMEQGYYTFRQEREQRGHGCPQNFNPPVHWNELYDNKLFTLSNGQFNDPGMRRRYYSLDDMKMAAAKATDMGCEALYLDPGWDTNFGSKLWDELRLGPYQSFIEMLTRDYGLKCSLHTPLSGWCDPTSYPDDCNRVDRFGTRLTWTKDPEFLSGPLCGASHQYNGETKRRLAALAKDGAAYFMFDGTMYNGECWDPNHGHAVPSRLHDHVNATCNLARAIHSEYPQVLIEMHDPASGGSRSRVAPIYFGHGTANGDKTECQGLGFDSVWAFELMWDPMADLLSGRSIALYYYNLAYSLPLYIHIDLRSDNRNALVFWWNASTCRHLGIGGTHPDSEVVNAHRQAMKLYLKSKPLFVGGAFFGLNELTHLHASRDGESAVINCFNLENHTVQRNITIDPANVRLSVNKSFSFTGAVFRKSAGKYIGNVEIAPLGHTLITLL
jgi:hypothetical protein